MRNIIISALFFILGIILLVTAIALINSCFFLKPWEHPNELFLIPSALSVFCSLFLLILSAFDLLEDLSKYKDEKNM